MSVVSFLCNTTFVAASTDPAVSRDGEASPASVVFDEDVVVDLLADASKVMWTYEKVGSQS